MQEKTGDEERSDDKQPEDKPAGVDPACEPKLEAQLLWGDPVSSMGV